LVPVSISVAPIIVEDKNVGSVGMYKDISQLKQTERELKTALEKLQVVGSLTRHDARNKLSVVTGNAYLAEHKLSGDHEALGYLSEIGSAVQQIENIFDFARTYERLGREESAYMSVERSLEEAVQRFSDLKGTRLVNDCQGLTVLADSLLTSLFYNLIDNSLKHGEKVKKIRVYSGKTGKDRLELIYEDDGVGIPKAEKEKIFMEDYGKGTCHGLYLIRKMCKVYGWSIRETGKYGRGAQFTIIIPNASKSGKANYRLEREGSQELADVCQSVACDDLKVHTYNDGIEA
jgi:signal transduction histidine kinase